MIFRYFLVDCRKCEVFFFHYFFFSLSFFMLVYSIAIVSWFTFVCLSVCFYTCSLSLSNRENYEVSNVFLILFFPGFNVRWCCRLVIFIFLLFFTRVSSLQCQENYYFLDVFPVFLFPVFNALLSVLDLVVLFLLFPPVCQVRHGRKTSHQENYEVFDVF